MILSGNFSAVPGAKILKFARGSTVKGRVTPPRRPPPAATARVATAAAPVATISEKPKAGKRRGFLARHWGKLAVGGGALALLYLFFGRKRRPFAGTQGGGGG